MNRWYTLFCLSVKSWVIDVVLQPENGNNLSLSNLKKPVQLYIPQNSNNGSNSDILNKTVHYFVKPSYEMNDSKLIQYHEINIPHERNVVHINLKPVTSSPVSACLCELL